MVVLDSGVSTHDGSRGDPSVVVDRATSLITGWFSFGVGSMFGFVNESRGGGLVEMSETEGKNPR
jgi:hypothetical protein